MSERQRGLGRGLSALLGEQASEEVALDGSNAPQGVAVVPIESVKPNKDQPRKIFNAADLEELAGSIRERGVLQPILVRRHPREAGQWEIIAGERRWRAAQAARQTTIPILVREMDDAEIFEVAIVENVQRTDLNPLEEAEAYSALVQRHGRTQDEVAGLVHKSRSHVANTLRLLQLPEEVLVHVREGRLTAGHARALIGVPGARYIAERAAGDGLSVRQVEKLARAAVHGPQATARPPRSTGGSRGGEADTAALEQDLSDTMGLKVEITDMGDRGLMTLHYGSLEQLDDLCRRLTRP